MSAKRPSDEVQGGRDPKGKRPKAAEPVFHGVEVRELPHDGSDAYMLSKQHSMSFSNSTQTILSFLARETRDFDVCSLNGGPEGKLHAHACTRSRFVDMAEAAASSTLAPARTVVQSSHHTKTKAVFFNIC